MYILQRHTGLYVSGTAFFNMKAEDINVRGHLVLLGSAKLIFEPLQTCSTANKAAGF